MEQEMNVVKRNGKLETLSFDKILQRIRKIGMAQSININYQSLTMKVIDRLYDNIPTQKIDEFAAEQCAVLSTLNPDYGILASRIVISNHQKATEDNFYNIVNKLYQFKDKHGVSNPILSKSFYEFTKRYKKELNAMIDYSRDYLIDYFGFKTLEKAYLLKTEDKIVERPQHMWLRVAIAIHSDIQSEDSLTYIKETYDLMSLKYFTHATPTLFSAGTPTPQLSSCYLVAMEDDSIDGIYNTLKECALISKYSGGIGLHIHNIRAKGSYIHGTNGSTDGLVPMLKVFNSTARYVNQAGRRNGSFAIYLETWHPDIEDFLELKKNHGDEDSKCRDLFYAIWTSDLFMERIEKNGAWSLFCPNECPGLSDVYGDDFRKLYTKYENEGCAKKTIKARDLWFRILDAQMETGTPYILYKDACNNKSNQKNIGTIKSSNLCCEILEYSDKNETAVCNLASIALPTFVDSEKKVFHYDKLHDVVKVVTNNLDRVIDINFYPTEKTRVSNFKHRPIGIGVQGLTDAFLLLDLPYHSDEAREINRNIFETIYHAALEKSNEIAMERSVKGVNTREKINEYDFELLEQNKGYYSSFEGSPASQGILQMDMWGVKPSDRYNWLELKERICKYGLRNSLLVAPMPTASTSQILGFNECFEPFTSNIYSRKTLAGEFIIVNKYLVNELIRLGYWNEDIKNNIIANKGSVQQLTFLPDKIREKYKIVWEIPMRFLIDLAVDRGAYICQSQSLNLWVEDPNYNILTSMHFYSWKKGLKTGIYYLRRKAKHQAQQFTIEPTAVEEEKDSEDPICEACSA
jgi:ribonucleotide reductase alpha subunit